MFYLYADYFAYQTSVLAAIQLILTRFALQASVFLADESRARNGGNKF